MRIGIITQPLGHNYGGILQNWALQQVLKQMGHEPITIRINHDKLIHFRGFIHDIKAVFLLCRGKKASFVNPFRYRAYSETESGLRPFVIHNIETTKIYDKCPRKVIDDYRLEALISGSDQVWRPKYNHNISNQYLAFARGRMLKKVAYAASFGADNWEYSTDLEQKCSKFLVDFDAVSVREYSAVAMCKEHFSVDADWVLDPTLLLDSRHYDRICSARLYKEPYAFVYLLDINQDVIQRIVEVSRSKGLKTVIKSANFSVTKEDSIGQWLSLIKNAEMVYTDSFHGTIFSLIYHRQFVTFVNVDRGSARFSTLARLFPIEDNIISFNDDFPNGVVDYEIIGKILEREKKSSREWLKSCFVAGNDIE